MIYSRILVLFEQFEARKSLNASGYETVACLLGVFIVFGCRLFRMYFFHSSILWKSSQCFVSDIGVTKTNIMWSI